MKNVFIAIIAAFLSISCVSNLDDIYTIPSPDAVGSASSNNEFGIIESFFCNGSLANVVDSYFTYSAVLMGTGDLMITAHYRDELSSGVESTVFYSPSQSGYANAQVILDLYPNGYDIMTLDRQSMVLELKYYDIDPETIEPQVWKMKPEVCIHNFYN